MGLVPAARDRVDETTGGAAHDDRRDHQGCLNAAEGSSRPSAWIAAAECSGGECLRGVLGAVRGDGWVLGLPGSDDGVQVPQDRDGDHGLCLGRGELVVLPAGQVLVAGGIDGVGALRVPDCQAQPGTSLPG
jgi:hypothetical protein